MADTLAWAVPGGIALAALIQPWILAGWNKFVRRGRIEVYKTGNVEVGFSGLGPTLGLQGTLRAVHHDSFISAIRLRLTRRRDRSQHEFEWGAFRAPSITIGQPVTIEVPAGFMLSANAPYRYNIQFFDRQLQEEMRPVISPLSKAWQEALTAVFGAGGGQLTADELRQVTDRVRNTLRGAPVYVDAFTALDRLCYWDEGQWDVEMVIETAQPHSRPIWTWGFSLARGDADSLRLNRVEILEQVLGSGAGQVNFAFVDYHPSPPSGTPKA